LVLLALKGVNRLKKIKKLLINLISFKEPENKEILYLKETPEESPIIEKEEKEHKKESLLTGKVKEILKNLLGLKAIRKMKRKKQKY
jgi:hypothetical protein